MLQLIIRYRDYTQLLELKDRITIITGDSATGKSSMLRIGSLQKSSLINIQIDDSRFEVICIKRTEELNDTSFSEKRIYIIDEGVRIDDEAIRVMKPLKDCYFIIITRKLARLRNLNYDLYSIKKLVEIEKSKFVLVDYNNLRNDKF